MIVNVFSLAEILENYLGETRRMNETEPTERPLMVGSDQEVFQQRTRYTMLGGEKLGSSPYAEVYRARHADEVKDRAVKIIIADRLDPDLRHYVTAADRLQFMRNFWDINLIHVDHIFYSDKLIWIFMECGTRSMATQITEFGPGTVDEVKRWISGVAGALEYLHSIGVAHQAVIAGNLILNSFSQCKLTCSEFYRIFLDPAHVEAFKTGGIQGLERVIGQSSAVSDESHEAKVRRLMRTFKLEPSLVKLLGWFAPPEGIPSPGAGSGSELPLICPMELDLWSLGVVIYYIITARHPFDVTGRISNESFPDQIRNETWTKWLDPKSWLGQPPPPPADLGHESPSSSSESSPSDSQLSQNSVSFSNKTLGVPTTDDLPSASEANKAAAMAVANAEFCESIKRLLKRIFRLNPADRINIFQIEDEIHKLKP